MPESILLPNVLKYQELYGWPAFSCIAQIGTTRKSRSLPRTTRWRVATIRREFARCCKSNPSKRELETEARRSREGWVGMDILNTILRLSR